MSRSGREFGRGRVATIKRTPADLLAMFKNEVKRRLAADGLLATGPREPRYEYHWLRPNGQYGMVKANNNGEGRNLIKAKLGLRKKDKLPADAQVQKVDPRAAS
jgi:hypothetical protein